MDETKEDRFGLAHRALGSRVQRVERSVYELDTDLGEFDLVFCGDLLIHLKDPVTAIQRIHSVTPRQRDHLQPDRQVPLRPATTARRASTASTSSSGGSSARPRWSG